MTTMAVSGSVFTGILFKDKHYFSYVNNIYLQWNRHGEFFFKNKGGERERERETLLEIRYEE